jgi:hypothetical protein
MRAHVPAPPGIAANADGCAVAVMRSTGFDPQVAGIVRVSAKFEWHEMVVLNVFQRAGVPVCRRVFALFDLGNGNRRAD